MLCPQKDRFDLSTQILWRAKGKSEAVGVVILEAKSRAGMSPPSKNIHAESRSKEIPVLPLLLCCALTPCFNTSESQCLIEVNKICKSFLFFLIRCV